MKFHTKAHTWAAGFCLLLIAGCGGGGESPPPAPCAAVRIQLFGDSTTVGYNATDTPRSTLQAFMDSKYGKGAVEVSAIAVSGSTSWNLLTGTTGFDKPWPQRVDADIAVISYGINDKYVGWAPETYMGYMRQLGIAPTRVVFQTPLPHWSAHYPEQPSTSFAPEMRAVAKELDLATIDNAAFAASVSNWQATYTQDGVHPTSDGYRLLATQSVGPTLVPIVNAMRCR